MSGPLYRIAKPRPPECDVNSADFIPLQHEASEVVQEVRAVSISLLGKLEVLFKDQAWKALLAHAEKLGQPYKGTNLSEEAEELENALSLIDKLLEQEGASRRTQPMIRFGMLHACDSAVLLWTNIVGKLREIHKREDYRNLQSILDGMVPQPDIRWLDWETQGFHMKEATKRFCRLVEDCKEIGYLMSPQEAITRSMPNLYPP